MNENQVTQLSRLLKEMNELLEKILHIQFGINDKKWIDSIQSIEFGFAKAVNFIGEIKGKKMPAVLTKEDVDEILS